MTKLEHLQANEQYFAKSAHYGVSCQYIAFYANFWARPLNLFANRN